MTISCRKISIMVHRINVYLKVDKSLEEEFVNDSLSTSRTLFLDIETGSTNHLLFSLIAFSRNYKMN